MYAGDLAVKVGDNERAVRGQLELQLGARQVLSARFAGPSTELGFLDPLGVTHEEARILVPAGAQLAPPREARLPESPAGVGWIESSIPLSEIQAGESASAERFIVHISGALEAHCPAVEIAGGKRQRQLAFTLPGWDLILAPVDDRHDENDFTFVVEATPAAVATADDIHRLCWRLFILLSFMTGREVGVSPVCGLDKERRVVWAHWAGTRLRPGRPGVRWCPGDLVATALPAIAAGFEQLSTNQATEAVVDRAISRLLAADGDEVLDVRVPVACSGLELLAWEVLQRHGWVRGELINEPRFTAAASTRLLLQWAGIPVDIPSGFDRLAARARDHGQTDRGGPEALFEVRNRLLHPPKPKQLNDFEWPTAEELIESWQLANWYLELVILRILGYEGKYWSRLRLGRYSADIQPVPWAPGAQSAPSV